MKFAISLHKKLDVAWLHLLRPSKFSNSNQRSYGIEHCSFTVCNVSIFDINQSNTYFNLIL